RASDREKPRAVRFLGCCDRHRGRSIRPGIVVGRGGGSEAAGGRVRSGAGGGRRSIRTAVRWWTAWPSGTVRPRVRIVIVQQALIHAGTVEGGPPPSVR